MPGPINAPSPGRDEWIVEVLEDGRIKITTGATSPAIHTTADKLLAEINRLAGGEVQRERRKGVHGHTHEKGRDHAHG